MAGDAERPTGSPGPAPDTGADPHRADELATLRRLLNGQEQDRLRALEDRFDALEVTAEAVSLVLPEAVMLRATSDPQLARALAPAIESGLAESVHRNPDPVVDAIYPTLGPAIRKSIADALAGFVDTLNRVIEHSFSVTGLRWRFKSWRTGVPYAEIVLRDALVYQVEQVFLIHGETGLLLAHAAAPSVHSTDGDLVSGMLTAIRDFVADSFEGTGTGAGGLREFTVGDRVVLVEPGPRMVLAGVVRGQPPASLLPRLQETLESLHRQYRGRLQAFDGDNAPFATAVPALEDCLDTVLRTDETPARPLAPRVAWAVVGLAIIVVALLGYRSVARWNTAIARLASQPGIVLIEADHGWRRSAVSGLRDPLAVEPSVLLADAGLDLDRIDAEWRPYLSLEPEILIQRAAVRLDPPPSLRLVLNGDIVRAQGAATPAWVAQAGSVTVAGANTMDLSEVELVASTALEAAVEDLEALHVLFPVGSLSLAEPVARDTLQAVIDAFARVLPLAGTEGWRVEVTMIGRSDSSGVPERNERLSLERSQVVRDALEAAGVAVDRVRLTGLGLSDLLTDDDPERASALNRSVSFALSLTPALP